MILRHEWRTSRDLWECANAHLGAVKGGVDAEQESVVPVAQDTKSRQQIKFALDGSLSGAAYAGGALVCSGGLPVHGLCNGPQIE